MAGSAGAKGASLFQLGGHSLRPTYHHELSTAQIEGMSQIKAPSRNSQEPGLTLFEYEVSSQYEMAERSRANGPLKIWAKSIHINFFTTRMDVYVTSQYPVGSCQYQAVLDHENTHVAINQRIFQKYHKLLAGELRRITVPTQAHPMIVTNEAEGEAFLDSKIKPLLARFQERFAGEVRRENAKIDTPASYARVQSKCKNW
jgi:hypothetical protein